MKDEQFSKIIEMLNDIRQDQAQAKLALELDIQTATAKIEGHMDDIQKHPPAPTQAGFVKEYGPLMLAGLTVLVMMMQTWQINIHRVDPPQAAHGALK